MAQMKSQSPLTKKRLKELRESIHLTQQQMADELGVNIRLYQKYESEQDETPLRKVVQLAVLHVVNCDYRRRPRARS